MKFLVILQVFAASAAIKVPLTWSPQKKYNLQQVPLETILTRLQTQTAPKKYYFKPSATNSDWTPIFPSYMLNSAQNRQVKPVQYMQYNSAPVKKPQDIKTFRSYNTSPLYKNYREPSADSYRYRDDKTHEPHKESVSEIGDHEVALEVPIRPIYPGEGQWAKKGTKHRPYISNHKFTELEDDEGKPEGHEVFEENQKLFEMQRQKFPLEQREDEEEAEEEDADDEPQEFVPVRLYTQVRRSETEEHLPRLVEDPRLREVIKDSKIQTVYTEEGYEDIAYDHAGHEKTAEQNEGLSEFNREIEKEKQRRDRVKDLAPEAEEDVDSVSSGTQHDIVNKPVKIRKDKLLKTQETKTTSMKDQEGGSEMEVLSEIKVLATPQNGTKTHRYIKIAPKIYKYPHLESTTQSPHQRHKRFTNDFHEVQVDTDFIDKIKHDIPQPVPVQDKPKYPYYKDKTLNPYSPLRYAEDLNNIPRKTEDPYAFYNQANGRMECAEVQSDVDPIPARIKEADADPENMEDATDVQELAKTPRLRNLGDKIDCFKLKYFGANPLDSPFFKEKEVGPVIPLIDIFKKRVVKQAVVDVKPNEIDDNSLKSRPKAVKLEVVAKQPEPAVISIITTPKYTIDLKPKHIYHQIELLRYLPPYNTSSVKNATSETPPASDRRSRVVEDETTTTVSAAPNSQALRSRRRRIRPPPPKFHIFDVNKYLPRTSYALLNTILRSTVRPSEAHYKQEIKPSEQMAVFADVLNNIKNSTKDQHQIAASSSRVVVHANNFHHHDKNPISSIERTNSFYLTTTATPTRGTAKYTTTKSEEVVDETRADRDRYANIELLKVRKVSTSLDAEEPVTDASEDTEEATTTSDVMGLMPPGPTRYKTIVAPKLAKPEEVKMNRFYVVGMKPPSMKQKALLYSDFKSPGAKFKTVYLNRGRRSAQRPAYSEVVRDRSKPIDVEDDAEVVVQEDDDYVPHRPRNYHYDEKTGRIVYDSKTEAPEEEYIEVTEDPLPVPTRRNAATTPRFNNFTGPSFVDFVRKLRSDPNYQVITDPPTTEKSEEAPTTGTTTSKPVSTTPPQFLSIVAKVKTDTSYKEIADTKKSTTTTTTTAATEAAEESQLENVQNSPGGQVKVPNFQIFDINDYLPKIKNYTPRTSIDYSKYKTIERANSRNSETEDPKSDNVSQRDAEISPVMSESKHEDVQPLTTEEPTTAGTTSSRRIRTRGRSRGTRRPTSQTTTTTEPTSEAPQVQHDKPRRSFPRRRRVKINRNSEPEATTEEDSTKIVRRRHERAQSTEDVTPIASVEETTTEEVVTEAAKETREGVQVFKAYDTTKKHGGNYRREEESETKKVHDVKRLTDVVPKPDSFYTDPKLPKKVNQLMEVQVSEEEVAEAEENQETTTGDYDYEAEEKTTTTKKPVFVKDPNKRLYYYAPL